MEHEYIDWWRPRHLEELFDMSQSRQARLRCDGKLPYHKIGSYVYYNKDEINQMIQDAKVV